MLVSEAMVHMDGPMAGMVLDMAGVHGVTRAGDGVTLHTDGDGVTPDMDGVTLDTVGVIPDTVGVTLDTDGDITPDIRVITARALMANVMHTIRGEMQDIRDLTQGTSALKTNLIRQEGPLLQETWPQPMIREETELLTEAATRKAKTADPIVKDQITADLMKVQMVIINLETAGHQITTAGHQITTADHQLLLTGADHRDIVAVLQVPEAVPEDVKCLIIILITN